MKRGFTLIELTVVLAVIGLIIGGTMATLTASTQQAAYNSTITTLNAIDQALYNFASAFGRLPCPTSLILTPTSTSYGLEAGTTAGGTGTGECVPGMTPAANNGTASSAEEGGVPTRTLKLPDSYMYDAWGHKIRYAVDPTYTVSSSSSSVIPGNVCFTSTRAATVNDSTGAARTSAAAYVLISHGSTGHGGYSMYSASTMFNAGNNNSDVKTNCHCTNAAGTNGYNSTYVQETPYYTAGQTGNAAYFFDDIVSFKKSWQLVNPNTTSSSVAGSCTSNAFWLIDGGNYRIVQLTSGGVYQQTIGTAGSSGNKAYLFDGTVSGVATDKNGNIWVMDTWNGNLREYTSGGIWMKTLGGLYTDNACSGVASGATGCSPLALQDGVHTGTHCASPGSAPGITPVVAGTTYSCSGGSAQGEFNTGFMYNGSGVYGSQMAFDNTGNLWVVDSGNQRIQEFNISTGAWMNSIPTTSAGATSYPQGLYIDSSNNFWVLFPGNKKGATSATVCGLYNCTGGSCAQVTNSGCGSTQGKFANNGWQDNNHDPIGVDAHGNIWASDRDGSRIVEFYPSTGTYENVMTNIGCSGNQICNPDGVYFPPNNTSYAWIANDANHLYLMNINSGSFQLNLTSINGMTLAGPIISYTNGR